jgi:superfamily II DNA or RNA helicase
MVIVDEAHHICARVFSQSLLKFCPKYTLGLTATPDRKDGLTDVLYWFLGDSFFSIKQENRGKVFVRKMDYFCEDYMLPPPTNRLGKLSLVHMITAIVESTERTLFIIDIIKKAADKKRNVLVLSERRIHCETMHDMLKALDMDVSLYMGGMKAEELKEAEKAQIIIGTYSQAQEGLDIPKMDTLVMATPKSDIKQAVGRVLRETKGKKHDPVIWDIVDNWCILNNMFYKRTKVYRDMNAIMSKKAEEPTDEPFEGKCML